MDHGYTGGEGALTVERSERERERNTQRISKREHYPKDTNWENKRGWFLCVLKTSRAQSLEFERSVEWQ